MLRKDEIVLLLMGCLLLAAVAFANVSAQEPRSLTIVCPESFPRSMDTCIETATRLKLKGDWRGVGLCNEEGLCRPITELFQ